VHRHHNVQIFSPIKVSEFARTDTQSTVTLEDGRQLQAPLLIAADGANSRVREWAGFETKEWDYGHHAIVATVTTAQSHQATAWQIFRREGPLAFLPLASVSNNGDGAQHYSSIVWSTQPAEAEMLLQLSDAEFAQALGAAFEWRLGAITGVGKRFSFPLRARYARDYVQPGIALIGDAAHTIHPLAGQGINLGLLDAQALAEELLRAQRRGLSPAEPTALARYQRRRKGDNLAMLAAMEAFKRLFGTTDLHVRWLRNTGMKLFDRSAPLKRILIRQAMGIAR
jgi:2-octaprenylphenol hydroxylase